MENWRRSVWRRRWLSAASLLALSLAVPSAAAGAPLADQLVPHTKLRVAVIQFIPSTGDYRKWDALGGDFEIGSDGMVTVPALGSIPTDGLSADELAGEISTRLQAKLGLVDLPDASVQIIEYPPIYLVGAVATPGQYPYHPGMTVLEAVAIAGGELRAGGGNAPLDETIKLEADLQGLSNDILRSRVRLARLQAELAGGTDIVLPAEIDQADPAIIEIVSQERTIFTARNNELTRQVAGLEAMRDLYNAQLDVLDQKAKAVDLQIAQIEEQLDGVRKLVQKGTITVSRQTEVERVLAGLKSDTLDSIIAAMTARQKLNETEREVARLKDNRHSEAAAQVQAEQANLERLLLNQVTTMRLLRQATGTLAAAKIAENTKVSLSYAVTREQQGQASTISVSETEPLLPGDVLKVALQVTPATPAAGIGNVAPSEAPVGAADL